MSILGVIVGLAIAGGLSGGKDLPLVDLRGKGYGAWTMTGDAFQSGPMSGDLLVKFDIHSARDGVVVSSKAEGDGPQGTMTSPPFKIERNYISFLVAGGDYERYTCLNLLIDGKVVKSATGRRSDVLTPQSWDVRQFHGKDAQVEIVDHASGDWGHIDVDGITQTDQPEEPPYHVGPLYSEPLRPQFHFTARQWTMDRPEPVEHQEGWCNDLNGLIYYEGTWHMFAQRWASCWLHATSKDLIHWTEQQPAFWEEGLETGVQSGTCVVDYANTSGLSKDPKNPPMVAFWSRFDNHSQCMSYSLDKGLTWKRFEGNPVFDHAERDPKVFWYKPGNHWVMIMYGNDAYHILTSPDLHHWTDQHHPIPNSFECPDFFELPIDGDLNNKKWVLIQGNGNYSIGTFNGTEFHEETGRYECDLGPNFYATQSWHNTDTGDGRRIQIAWMRGSHFPGMPFNQQISFPCELSLHSTPDGLRIFRHPIKEIEKLQESPKTWANKTIAAGESFTLAEKGEQYRLKAEVEVPEGADLVFSLRGESVVVGPHSLTSGAANGKTQQPVRSVEILLDSGSVEAYVNQGELSSTRYSLPKSEGIFVKAEGGPVVIKSLELYPLRSAWPRK